ncbi:MAG: 16S rRNA (uracil(1498)-N(3))-methyltransferase [Porticoccaceae bacterium]|nr:16S rRNA (uracil(1498)-N(3))-methyltransferase [Porticoccaceae bacterium]
MRIPRIYTPEVLALDGTVALDAQSSRHLLSVLRLKPGAELILFNGFSNGNGGEYRGVLLDHRDLGQSVSPLAQTLNKNSGKKSRSTKIEKVATVSIKKFIEVNRESPLSIELGIGISRGERMDWVIQKSTELGVQKIIPLFTERTEVKLDGERLDKKCAHWRQIAISACEQSGRTRLPEIAEPIALADWLPEASPRFVLDPEAGTQLMAKDVKSEAKPTGVVLLVGPEGGLSESEVQQSVAKGFVGITLGPRILRTETAPLAAITQCQTLWGDLGSN